jgi:hypothetical protein
MEYKPETKSCQNCKNDFTIESEDFSFYEKIKVPPPTFCAECRFVRRYVWRNERFLHKRNCDFCKKSIISMYAPESKYTVYCPDCYKSDNWDPEYYALDIDENKNFFSQYRELLSNVPRMSLMQNNIVNSPYSNYVESAKNIYLSFSVTGEDIYYSRNITNSKQSYDCLDLFNSEKCYENVACDRNYSTCFAYNSKNAIDCKFIYNCSNVSSCFMCTNLKGGEYCYKNNKYSKDEYNEIVSSYSLNTIEELERAQKEFAEMRIGAIHKYANLVNTVMSTGDDLFDSSGTKNSFSSIGCENSKYLMRCPYVKDSMDCMSLIKSDLCYEHMGGGAQSSQNLHFTVNMLPGSNFNEYCDSCSGSSYLFGCISLKNKSYCILNKQYSKEEYFMQIDKIKKTLESNPYIDSNGRMYKYGEFFPLEFSPFAYNETTAYEYYPLSKNEILANGFKYREIENKDYKPGEGVYECKNHGNTETLCTSMFRVLPDEIIFYEKMGMALPDLCPNCRYFKRTQHKNPPKLWHRQCMCDKSNHANHGGKCEVEFETSYAPDRPEIVYCEKCYQQEVY